MQFSGRTRTQYDQFTKRMTGDVRRGAYTCFRFTFALLRFTSLYFRTRSRETKGECRIVPDRETASPRNIQSTLHKLPAEVHSPKVQQFLLSFHPTIFARESGSRGPLRVAVLLLISQN